MSTRTTYNWEKIREDFLNSNLSVEAFSKLNGFSKSAGHNHLNDIASKRRQMLQEKSEKTKNPSFISLELSNTTVKAPGTQEETSKKLQEGTKHIEQIDIPIELKIGAFSLILHSGFDKDDLLSILEVLKESC